MHLPRLAGILLSLCAVGCLAPSPRPAFSDPYDLNRKDCRIGVLAGFDSETLSRKIYNKAEIVPYDNFRSAVWHLLSEKIDGLVFDEHVLRLAQWRYPDRFRILEKPIDTDPSVIAVSAKRPDVLKDLNAFIARIRDSGLYDEMFLRWCHDPERRPEDVPDLEEIARRGASDRVLRVGVDPIQEPNAYFDRNGRLVGYDIEFACRFAHEAGYRITFVEDDEKKLFGRMEAGELDVIISNLAREPERAGILWSDGYLDSDVMMLVKEREDE